MINFQKLFDKLEEKKISTYTIKKYSLIPQGTLYKLKTSSGNNFTEISNKLTKYREEHDGAELKIDVSTKTIESLCQLLQCQPYEIMDWSVQIDPAKSAESVIAEKKVEKKSLNVLLPQDDTEQLDAFLKENGLNSKSEFVRQAIKEKMERTEK